MSGIVAYIVVFFFTFFTGSFMLARYRESPTDPTNFFMLVGAALIWSIAIPLTMAILLLLCIAELAVSLSRGAK